MLVPVGKRIRIFNITHFKPREPPPFPFTEEDDMIESAKRMKLSDDRDKHAGSAAEGSSRARDEIQDDSNGEDENNDVDHGEEEDDEDYVARPSGLAELFTALDGWDVDLSRLPEPRRESLPDITACEVAAGGRAILGVGAKGTLYVWRLVE